MVFQRTANSTGITYLIKNTDFGQRLTNMTKIHARPPAEKIKNAPHKNFMATPLHTSRFLPHKNRPAKKREECNRYHTLKQFRLYNENITFGKFNF